MHARPAPPPISHHLGWAASSHTSIPSPPAPTTPIQIPIQIPAGMPADQAMAVVEYLRNNPDAAKAAWEQAKTVLQTPGMADAMIAGQVRPSGARAWGAWGARAALTGLAGLVERGACSRLCGAG
jgi:hypothetical protein